MKYILLTIISLSFINCIGQNSYSPIKAQGEIPQEFLSALSEKYYESIEELDRNEGRTYSDKKEFLLKSNYSVTSMLQGGQILYNDPISNYVNEIADEIMLKNQDIPSELRFYVSRSTTANAFSTNQGIIFITTGLISQLENEAQLAFIMCHEISHYVKNHTIEGFLERKNTIRNNRNSRNINEFIALMSKYNKSQELEADSEGLEFFLNLNYDEKEAVTAFNVLHYSYLPFNEIPFELDYLVNEDFKILGKHKMDSINVVNVFNEDYDDSESTHPNIWKRKQEMIANLRNRSSKGNEWFVIGEDKFKECRLLARKEGIRIHLIQGEYPQAIYESFLIHKEDSTETFSQISKAKALYGIQQHKVYSELREVLPRTKDVEGESSRLVYFLNELSEEELGIVAVQNLHQLTMDYPDNEYYYSLLEDCVIDMVYESEMHFDDFLNERKTQTEPIIDTLIANQESEIEEITNEVEEEKRERSGKYGIIEEAKEEKFQTDESNEDGTEDYEEDYNVYSLIKPLQDSTFYYLFKEVSMEYEEEKERDDALTSRQKWDRKKREQKRKEKHNDKIRKNGTSLGLESAVIYSPNVYQYDVKTRYEYLESEDSEILFNEALQEYSVELGKDYNFLGFNDQNEIDTEDYNDMSRLSAFTFEANRLEEIEVEMIPSEAEYSDELIERLGSEYLVMTSITSYLEKRNIGSETWVYSALLYPTLPITITLALTRKKHNIHGLKVIDLKDGSLIHRSYRDLKIKSSNKVIEGVAYDTIHQISRERK